MGVSSTQEGINNNQHMHLGFWTTRILPLDPNAMVNYMQPFEAFVDIEPNIGFASWRGFKWEH
jgi:hypothetical protein